MASKFGQDDWAELCRVTERVLRVALACYKRDQIERRVEAFLRQEMFADLATFVASLSQDRQLALKFHTYLTIHVTEFFRDPSYWDNLASALNPSPGRVKVWSAGCAQGAEPVSVAIWLTGLGRPCEVLGTDSDELILARARTGMYTDGDIKGVPPRLVSQGFESRGAGGWVVRPEILARIRYQRHNLLADPFPAGFDVILCRNVLIYFEEGVRREVVSRLVGSLAAGGLLFIGATETILFAREAGLSLVGPSLYRKN